MTLRPTKVSLFQYINLCNWNRRHIQSYVYKYLTNNEALSINHHKKWNILLSLVRNQKENEFDNKCIS